MSWTLCYAASLWKRKGLEASTLNDNQIFKMAETPGKRRRLTKVTDVVLSNVDYVKRLSYNSPCTRRYRRNHIRTYPHLLTDQIRVLDRASGTITFIPQNWLMLRFVDVTIATRHTVEWDHDYGKQFASVSLVTLFLRNIFIIIIITIIRDFTVYRVGKLWFFFLNELVFYRL